MTPFTVGPREFVLGVSGFSFGDLHRPERLRDLYDRFCEELAAAEPDFWAEWDSYRAAPDQVRPAVEVSRLLVAMSRRVSAFLARLFGVGERAEGLAQWTRAQDELFRFKVEFVRRRVVPGLKTGGVHSTAEEQAIVERLVDATRVEDVELAVARAGCALLDREAASLKGGVEADAAHEKEEVAREVEALKKWCAARLHDPAYHGWVTFRFPETLDYQALVPLQQVAVGTSDGPRAADMAPASAPAAPCAACVGPESRLRHRDGFELTDRRMDGGDVLGELYYCVLCHERDKDSCSKGYRGKEGSLLRNPLGIELAGCPLDEKISEMHAVRREGDALGALALVMLDNPMCPGTGHRICNDCMKACIYQKQEPVNIPQAETGVLTDVLGMPWGVEIYGLLTRWNPLNVRRPYALPYNGRNVMIVGLGPAGYTLAHYLLNEGFGVAGIDGLKIEPLPPALVGANGQPPQPIAAWSEIYRALDERVLEGFGGVSEYGITVRWDKNFLTLIHLTLARRDRFRIYGGIRFGGTIPIEDAWALGFDHVAIAAGAGRPTIIDMRNNLIRGVRKASDFLMALQLTGAFKRGALANLQVRLPAVVVGGGLTAIDTPTELMAY